MSEITLCKPEEIGYDSNHLNALNELLAGQMEKGVIRCAGYCIAKDGKIFADHAIGKHSYREEDPRPLQPDAIHGIASITKIITATAIFRLIGEGKLWVTENVCDIIPEFSKYPYDQIKIEHLLSHTSGFAIDPGVFPDNGKPHVWELIEEAFQKGDTDWVKASTGYELRFDIGTQWGYSSFGFVLLGEIIHRITGQRAEDYIKEHIFIPCEMEDTSFGIDASKLDRIVINNSRREEKIESIKSGKKEESPWDQIPGTGGGIYSTAQDLVKFGMMLLNKGTYQGKHILGRKAVEKMTSVYTDRSVKDYCWGQVGIYRQYGLGPDLRRTEDCLYSPGTFFHEGSGKCGLIMDPVENMAAAYFLPYIDDNVWNPNPIWNTHYVIWAGLI